MSENKYNVCYIYKITCDKNNMTYIGATKKVFRR